jgi:acyl carrier protein
MTVGFEQRVFEVIREVAQVEDGVVSDDTALIGDGGMLDSMKLVEVCLLLEDVASAHNRSFDWTSDSAMSRSRSIFRTAGSLAAEFANQMQRSQ